MQLNQSISTADTSLITSATQLMSSRTTNIADVIRKKKALQLRAKIQRLQWQREKVGYNQRLEYHKQPATNTRSQYIDIKQSQIFPKIEKLLPIVINKQKAVTIINMPNTNPNSKSQTMLQCLSTRNVSRNQNAAFNAKRQVSEDKKNYTVSYDNFIASDRQIEIKQSIVNQTSKSKENIKYMHIRMPQTMQEMSSIRIKRLQQSLRDSKDEQIKSRRNLKQFIDIKLTQTDKENNMSSFEDTAQTLSYCSGESIDQGCTSCPKIEIISCEEYEINQSKMTAQTKLSHESKSPNFKFNTELLDIDHSKSSFEMLQVNKSQQSSPKANKENARSHRMNCAPEEDIEYYLKQDGIQSQRDMINASELIEQRTDPEQQQRKLRQLGLLELNQNQGWGLNFHEGFKDLNPILNPQYKFIRKSRRRLEAENVLTKINHKLSEEIENKKLTNFIEIIKSGQSLSDHQIQSMSPRYKQAYIDTKLNQDQQIMQNISKSLQQVFRNKQQIQNSQVDFYHAKNEYNDAYDILESVIDTKKQKYVKKRF